MITRNRLMAVLDYDADTGIFLWKRSISRRVRVGERAGAINTKGYRQITIDGVPYVAHRLVWLITYDKWPTEQLDHINGDRDDNRVANLRQASQTQNKANGGAYRNNTSGYRGVSWHKRRKRWIAHIRVGGKRKSLGYFVTPDAAYTAYLAAAKDEFGEFAHRAVTHRE
jgi:hypothetical protein